MFRPLYGDRNTNSQTVAREIEEKMDAHRQHDFNLPNMRNIDIMEKLKGVSPAYAKDALTRNELLRAFALKIGGGIDLLKQPVCGRCEMPCTWGTYDYKEDLLTKDRFATCDCGHVTKNPITVEEYLMEYMKGIDPKILQATRPALNDIFTLTEGMEERK